jgi:hypothetical protein
MHLKVLGTLKNIIQLCFICHFSDSTVLEDEGFDRTQDCCDFGIGSQML